MLKDVLFGIGLALLMVGVYSAFACGIDRVTGMPLTVAGVEILVGFVLLQVGHR